MAFQIDYFYRWNERIVQTAEPLTGDGAISDIISVNLAPNRLLVSDPSGKIITSSLVTASEAATLAGIDTDVTIQDQLDSKQGALTFGDVTESTSSVLTLNGNTGAIIGSGLSIQVKLAGAGQSGYLSSADWTTFNNKLSGSLANGYILIGDGSAQAVNLGSLGDISASVAGGLAIKNSTISNAHIVSNAAITRTKLATGNNYRILANNGTGIIGENAALTPAFALISDGNGQLAVSTTTALRLSYLSTATSDLQVQINTLITGKATHALVQAPTAAEDGYAITWNDASQMYKLSDPVVQGIPVAGTLNQVLMKYSGLDYEASWTSILTSHITDISVSAADINLLLGLDSFGVTTTNFEHLSGTSSNIQTQLGNKLSNSLAQDAIFVGNASNVASQLAAGTNGQVLQLVGTTPQWQTIAGTGTVTSIDVAGGTTGLTFSGGPISTSGTITMAGTLIAVNGGTGFASYTVGDLLYADTTTTFTKLVATSDGYVLTLASGVPVWAAGSGAVADGDYTDITVSSTGSVWTVDVDVNKAWTGTHSFIDNAWTLLDNVDPTKILSFQLSGITAGNTRTLTIPDASGTIALVGAGAALSKTDDTNVTLALGGGPTTALLSATSITVGWSGQLAVTRGGLGLATVAQGDIFYSDASNSIVALAKNTTATRYLSNTGASNNPAWAQVDLTNGVTGALPIANGGTGSATNTIFWRAADGVTLTGANTVTATGTNSVTFNYATLGANTGFLLNSNSTDAASNTQTLFKVTQTGANVTTTQTTHGGYFSNTKTGTLSTNIAAYFEASGAASNNYAIKTGTGSVLIGNASADTLGATTTRFDIRGTGTTTGITFRTASSANTARFTVTDAGGVSITSASGTTSLTISATAQRAIFITGSVNSTAIVMDSSTSRAMDGEFNSAGTAAQAIYHGRVNAGAGTSIYWQSVNMNPNTITSAGSKVTNVFMSKPGDGSVAIVMGLESFAVFTNTATPDIVTGYEWTNMNGGLSSALVRMRLYGDMLAIGSDFTPTHCLHIKPSAANRNLLLVEEDGGSNAYEIIEDSAVIKQAWFGSAPVAKATALTVALTQITHTAPGTPDYAIQDLIQGADITAGWGFATKDEGNTLLSVVKNLQVRLDQAEAKLQAYGLLT